MDWLVNNWKEVADVVAYIIASASIVVKLTPTPKDDEALAKVIQFLGLLSLNKKKT